MNKILLFASLFCVASTTSFAQRNCGTQLHEAHLEATVPGYSAENTKRIIAEMAANADNAKETNSMVLTIPVVVHVVYKNSTQNISDAQINSQIAVLNNDFARTNADAGNTRSIFSSIVGPSSIRFQLATTDPSGATTTGITRTSTSSTSTFDTGDQVKSSSTGGKNPWNPSKYLNIWVCELNGGILGYAQFPGGTPSTDGVVIGYNFFGTTGVVSAPYNKGRTATHEVGHFLGLYHIWGDDGGSCSGTDNISDTPNAGDANYTACAPDVVNTCGVSEMYENYMDYVEDACMNAFTNGQIARMENVLNTIRTELATGATPVTINCTPLALPYTQGFETSSGLPANWTSLNPDGSTTWERKVGVSHSGTASYGINLYEYASSEGQLDAVVSPGFNLGTVTGDVLSFWIAYAPYDDGAGTTANDELKVYSSSDCGSTWTLLYHKTGSTLGTSAATASAFVPTSASQWRQETINLTSSAITNIKFEAVSDYGNWMYLDDINISGSSVGFEELSADNFNIFPNPANDKMFVKTNGLNISKIEIKNALGQIVMTQHTSDAENMLSTDELCDGVYFISITADEKTYTKKVLIQK